MKARQWPDTGTAARHRIWRCRQAAQPVAIQHPQRPPESRVERRDATPPIKAERSSLERYWTSSISKSHPFPAAAADLPISSKRSGRSNSRSPLSARPGSGFMSMLTPPISMLKTEAKLRNPRSPRLAICRAASTLDRLRKTFRISGKSIRARLSPSGASMRDTINPSASPIFSISVSRTVLPVPRKPSIIRDRAERPRTDRPQAMRASPRTSPRPANSGRRRAGAGSKGVAKRVHSDFYPLISSYSAT